MSGPDPSLRYKIEQALRDKSVRLTAILPFYPETAAATAGRNGAVGAVSVRELSQIPPLRIAQEVYHKKYGTDMPASMQKMLSDVIKEVEA